MILVPGIHNAMRDRLNRRAPAEPSGDRGRTSRLVGARRPERVFLSNCSTPSIRAHHRTEPRLPSGEQLIVMV